MGGRYTGTAAKGHEGTAAELMEFLTLSWHGVPRTEVGVDAAVPCMYNEMHREDARMKHVNENLEECIARQCLAVRVRMLNRVITNLYDDALRPLGLKVSQLNILVVAAKFKTARPAEVCDVLLLDASTLSRNVDRMAAKGWLEVVPDEDKRTQPFRLTEAGRQLLGRASALWDDAQEKTKTLLGADGVRLLSRIERRLSRAGAGN